MFAKRYISAFIILLTLLGFYKEQTPAPNQEIDLQFTDSIVLSQETEEVIEAIKQELQTLGVTNIQVRQHSSKALKIAYYSQEDVAAIKEILIAKGFTSDKETPQLPSEETSKVFQTYANIDQYKLDVYELQTASDIFIGVHGKYILDLEKEYDKSPTTNSFANTNANYTGDAQIILLQLTYTTSNYTSILTETISYEIPDVRAGPVSSTLS
jgi:citrate lyase gamma subunit